MRSRPLATTLRAGFEITGYAISQMRASSSRTISTWVEPRFAAQRSGFEVTGYAMTASPKWEMPRAVTRRSGFEVTGYAMAI